MTDEHKKQTLKAVIAMLAIEAGAALLAELLREETKVATKEALEKWRARRKTKVGG